MQVGYYRGHRAAILTLALLIVSVFIIYAWVVIDNARENRVQYALKLNLITARLSADSLNVQWDNTIATWNRFIQANPLDAALRANDTAGVEQDLRDALELGSGPLFAAVYRSDASLVVTVPRPGSPGAWTVPTNASRTDWFRVVGPSEQVHQPATLPIKSPSQRPFYIGWALLTQASPPIKVMITAFPLGGQTRPAGYLLSYFPLSVPKSWLDAPGSRLDDLDSWLQQQSFDGGGLYIIDRRGRIVAQSGKMLDRSIIGTEDQPSHLMELALSGIPGAEAETGPHAQGDLLIGYAYAPIPEWTVLIVQPEHTAIDVIYALVGRFMVLLLPVLVLVLGAARTLIHLSDRQEKMAELLTQRNAQLQIADRVRSDFLANVSHDLRTPLTSIRLSISGLLESVGGWDEEETRECLRFANEEIDQLTARVRNLLEMSRLEANAWPSRKEPVDLTDIVGSVLERLRPVLRGRPIQADFPPEPLLIECDQAQIESVVVNLLENAAKYSPPGTPLRLRGELRSGDVVFTVQDEGPGVPHGDELRVFEKFYRAQAVSSVGGTGLGLAICKAIVEAHDGSIGMRNVLEGGAEFRFALPQFALPEESFP